MPCLSSTRLSQMNTAAAVPADVCLVDGKAVLFHFGGSDMAMEKLFLEVLTLHRREDEVLILTLCMSDVKVNDTLSNMECAMKVREVLGAMRCIVVGLIDGAVGMTTSSLLYSCDFVVATGTSTLSLSRGATYSVAEAKSAGLVDLVTNCNREAMTIVVRMWKELQGLAGPSMQPLDKDFAAAHLRRKVLLLLKTPPATSFVTGHQQSAHNMTMNMLSQSSQANNVAPNYDFPVLPTKMQSIPGDAYKGGFAGVGMLAPPGLGLPCRGYPAFDSESTTEGCGSSDSNETLEVEYSGPSGWAGVQKEKSFMLCNLPCRFTLPEVIQAVDSLGFAGTYQYIHLPCGGHSRKQANANLGYGFIKFSREDVADAFAAAFEGVTFPGTNSSKKCTTKVAYTELPPAQLRQALSRMEEARASLTGAAGAASTTMFQ
eukprot:TRINITY_DN102523_c0_g1_i1.p1 TRINITY_DN102523_c0_g1~~TRINITY_DN102523_c0_g1_i1.p1  ORF type:complete len:430 (-),score=90.27 TRINITY_DN102523_c0_g1_i1:280-1569(-)